jgi:colicin import membrane protein
MAEQKESSVLFSLKELMNLEEDRIKQEDEEKKRRAEAEVQSRVEAERRARDQEQMRLSAEEERRRSEEQRKKEEAARVEAIRHAEIEKARVEAEQRARMEAMTKQQEHERAMSSLKHDEHKKKLQRMVTFSIGGGVLLLVAVLGIYLGKIKPENEAREAAARAALVQQAEESAKMKRLLEEQTQKVNDTMAQLAAAHDENTRNELKQKLAEAQKQQQATRQAATGGGGRPSGGDAPAKKPCNCQAGDPICSCL